MADYYVKSGSGVEFFQQNHAYSIGDRMVPVLSDNSGWAQWAKGMVWECTIGGTSASGNPTWPYPIANSTTVTSGDATFIARTPGFSSAGTPNWSFATILLEYVFKYQQLNHPDRVFISSNHSENRAAFYTLDFTGGGDSGVLVVSVNDSVAPPTTRLDGAVIACDQSITLDHYAHILGVTFRATGFNYVQGSFLFLEDCRIELTGGVDGASFYMAAANGDAAYRFKNTWIKFSHANQSIRSAAGSIGCPVLVWEGGGVDPAGTAPAGGDYPLFRDALHNTIELDGVDLSSLPTNARLISDHQTKFHARGVKMPTGWTPYLNLSNTELTSILTATDRYIHYIENGAEKHFFEAQFGRVYSEVGIYRQGGAEDGQIPYSFRMAAIAQAKFKYNPLRSLPIQVWTNTSGSPITITLELIHDSATALTNQQVWLEATYPGTNGVLVTTDSAPGILASASNLTSSSVSWVGTGSFSNPNKQKVAVTLTPQKAGYITLRVALATGTSKTIYVCPKAEVS